MISSAAPSSAIRTRFVCHGIVGSERPSSSANAAATSSPRSPSAESVPAAPPSCAARPCRRSSVSRPAASITATSHPAAFRPKVVGTACCRSVRPTIGVSRCSRARRAHPVRTRATSSRIRSSARRVTSIAAVSITSWLVAPRWTKRACSSPTRSTIARTSGSAGLPEARPSASSRSQSNASTAQASAIAAAAVVRHEAGARARLRERALGLEHGGEPRASRDGFRQLLGHEQRCKRRHTAKNVVCPGPCKRMSNRSPPSSGTATSVSRCSGVRRDSTGSTAFASLSSGK